MAMRGGLTILMAHCTELTTSSRETEAEKKERVAVIYTLLLLR